jgi:Ca2+-binding EF-hand superfamily protein
MKALFLSAAAAVAFAGFTPAVGAPADAAPAHAKHARGPMSRDQVTQMIQKQFAALDSNHDGVVTRTEADSAGKAMHANLEKLMENRGEHVFDRLDSNKDGSVTKAEADAAFAKVAAKSKRPAPTWEKFATHLDSNKDGKISRAEFDAGQSKREQRMAAREAKRGGIGHMFEAADLNKDGRLTLKEANEAAARHFATADSNHDGSLSPEEIRAARPHGANEPKRS